MSLQVRNLTVEYHRDIEILRNVSLNVEKGLVTALIGPNGAGKSTLMKTLSGLLKPKHGDIYLDGVRLNDLPPDERVKHGLAVVLQRRSVFPQLTVRENLQLGGWRIRRDQRLFEDTFSEVINLFPDLKPRLDDKASSLSGGQQRMLEIARSLMTRPKVLLLDEPSAGLSPLMVKLVYRHIKELKDLSITIFLVDQNIQQCFSVADYLYVLELGEVKGGGSKMELSASLSDLIRGWLYLEQGGKVGGG
ncbi:High-affinity branched-chain amino acid transport ATP-binding protein LivF [archaeon HR01]|nr:High-affinity branched-chain amino acid transport ATP-binding protein LivF [archaeon HR01]